MSCPSLQCPLTARGLPGRHSTRSGTSRSHIPIWEPDVCIQCGLCSFVCPHATIRIRPMILPSLRMRRSTFKSIDATGKELKGLKFTVQVAPEDCTGCGVLRVRLPGPQEGRRGEQDTRLQGHQHVAQRAAVRKGSGELRLLPLDPTPRHHPLQPENRQGKPVRDQPLRVSQRLCGLRRNALHTPPHPALR